jgi:hypothetical protein
VNDAGKMLMLAAGVVVAMVGLPVLLIIMVSGTLTGVTAQPTSYGRAICTPKGEGAKLSNGATLTAAMLTNANTIMQVGTDLGVPPEGHAIALATALVESGLNNLDYGDRDSLGLFQQRPSQGWGTPEQILDPVYSSTKFYEKLVKVPNWQTRDPGEVAQAVQISAFPDRYGERMSDARSIQAGILKDGSCKPQEGGPPTGSLVDVPAGTGPAIRVDASIGPNLDALIKAALADGVTLGGSGWRSQQSQIELRKKNGCPDVWTAPASSCRVPTAIPGRSLHEVGLAIDFTCNGGSVTRGNTCDRWLMANAGRFGFKNLPSEAWHYSTTGS